MKNDILSFLYKSTEIKINYMLELLNNTKYYLIYLQNECRGIKVAVGVEGGQSFAAACVGLLLGPDGREVGLDSRCCGTARLLEEEQAVKEVTVDVSFGTSIALAHLNKYNTPPLKLFTLSIAPNSQQRPPHPLLSTLSTMLLIYPGPILFCWTSMNEITVGSLYFVEAMLNLQSQHSL